MTCEENKRCGRNDCVYCEESVKAFLARMAEGSLTAKKFPVVETVVSPGKCIHLGISVPNTEGGCRAMYECERGHGKVRPCVECKKCEDFAPEGVV
jgi:hypothetical protein